MKRILRYLLLTFYLQGMMISMAQESNSYAGNRARIACVGNSVTFGTGIAGREINSWPAQLQHKLGNKYLVGNFGLPGATLLTHGHKSYVSSLEYKNALDFNADIVIISLGLNDTDPRNWPNYGDEFITDYMKLIESFRNKPGKKVEVYVCQLTPIFDRHPRFISGTRDWLEEIQKAIIRVAKNSSCHLIDLHTPLYSRPDLFPDALHPNSEGATIIANNVYNELTGNFGGLGLPAYVTDHMVFQRNRTIPLPGKANRYDSIIVSFGGHQYHTLANYEGTWLVRLPAMKAGGPYEMKIKSSDKEISIRDILIGEVWLCSGQSNMEFPLRSSLGGEEETKNADNTKIRLLNFKSIAKTNDKAWDTITLKQVNNLNFFSGSWQRCSPAEASGFSAVAYYFGQKLQKQLKVPIGLIEIAVGGAPAEAFIDRRTLEFHPVLVQILKTWRSNDMIQQWCRERAAVNLENTQNALQRHPYEPAYLFESGISKVTSFPIQGVIWYQGESNAHNIELHEILFKTLVESWRKSWGCVFPFYFVQLPSLSRPSWPAFRDSQRRLAKSLRKCDMAITIDCGDSLEIHPRQKKIVGERLARLALFDTYQQKNIIPSGPLFQTATVLQSKVLLGFKNSVGLTTTDGKSPVGFEIAGEDRIFHPALASIIKGNIMLYNNQVKHPESVRYAWKPFFRGNLVNAAGIPPSPFHYDIKNPVN